MLGTAIGALLPVFFVLALGYAASRAKRFDADLAAGFNDLVLDYALPASPFVAFVALTSSRSRSDVSSGAIPPARRVSRR